MLKNTVLLSLFLLFHCRNDALIIEESDDHTAVNDTTLVVLPGANSLNTYLPLLLDRKIGLVANQTSVVFDSASNSRTHLVDTLRSRGVDISVVFAPEHGFRGNADNGEIIRDSIDDKTGIPIISLYGDNKKPKPELLHEIDLIVFDIQDVGARFYTYISTLHYVMEACAENATPMLILDRPNPNGHYVDGPILEEEHQSFVGMHPVPIVHGMTIGEYAGMINGEGWLTDGITCDLTVVPVTNYTHSTPYDLPIKPSPNLPNAIAVSNYPSLCLFEGTDISVGRGTDFQFQIIGSPYVTDASFNVEFKPQPNLGSKYPKHQGLMCNGLDLTQMERFSEIRLDWLISFYERYQEQVQDRQFFNTFFTKLAGTRKLQEQIEAGVGIEVIKSSWDAGIKAFKTKRKPYLLYPL